MLWKSATTRLRKTALFEGLTYRIPMPVKEVLLFSCGDSYPICPRCGESFDREYMLFCDRCGQRLAWEFYEFAAIIYAPRC